MALCISTTISHDCSIKIAYMHVLVASFVFDIWIHIINLWFISSLCYLEEMNADLPSEHPHYYIKN